MTSLLSQIRSKDFVHAYMVIEISKSRYMYYRCAMLLNIVTPKDSHVSKGLYKAMLPGNDKASLGWKDFCQVHWKRGRIQNEVSNLPFAVLGYVCSSSSR